MGAVDFPREVRTLQTERLRIVPLDLELMAAMGKGRAEFLQSLKATADEDWKIPPEPRSCRYMAHGLGANPGWAGWYPWYIVRESDRRVIGVFSFYYDHTDPTTVFVGYEVRPGDRGRGYATEGLKALLSWMLVQPKITRVCAEADRDNPASIRVMEKAGMMPLHSEDDGHVAYAIHSLLAPERYAPYPLVLARLSPFRYSKQDRERLFWKWQRKTQRSRDLGLAALIIVLLIVANRATWPIAALATVLIVAYTLWGILVVDRRPGSDYNEYLDEIHRLQIRDDGLYWPSPGDQGHFSNWDFSKAAIDRGDWIDFVSDGGKGYLDLKAAYAHPGLVERVRKVFTDLGLTLRPPS